MPLRRQIGSAQVRACGAWTFDDSSAGEAAFSAKNRRLRSQPALSSNSRRDPPPSPPCGASDTYPGEARTVNVAVALMNGVNDLSPPITGS